MKTRSRLIFLVFTLVVIAAGFLGWQIFGPALTIPAGNFLYIGTGATYQNAKDSIAEKGIVRHMVIFDRLARYLNYEALVKPGKYKITEGMSLFTLIRKLRTGDQSPVNLVITKLRTIEDLAKKIGDKFETDSALAMQLLTNPDSLLKYNLDTNTALTAIIPDTYTFTWNTSVPKVFKRLYTEQEKYWNQQRKSSAAALGLTEKQVYSLASIVEEETNRQQDKGKIASVYINRLRTGMRLAADPTVKFAMKNFGLKRVYFKHLTYPSPYNTYLNSGLPPGPICTPSKKTIDAVLAAPSTDYVFFVAKPDFSGYSNFAVTYEEHKRNARAYQVALDSIILLKQVSELRSP